MSSSCTPRRSNLLGPSLFDLLSSSWPGTGPAASNRGPAVNVWTQDHTVHVQAELPGVSASDLELSIQGDELVLSGQRPEVVDEGVTVQRRERPVGAFRRVITLPVEVDAEAVSAQLVDGVLSITLPAAAAAKPRVIPVQASES